MDAGYYIKYVHIKSTRLCKQDRVNPGTEMGEYSKEAGETNYDHVHVGFESPKYHPIDPGDYWPGGVPTQWMGPWGAPKPVK